MSEPVEIPELVVHKVGALALQLLYAEQTVRDLTAQLEALKPDTEV